ncbi:hypothetical protein BJ165DRAFT_1397464 [Panaeolus papilionaceus]|nr:hypothetical protein BJ165DRAFT_1397464 [Panaeolus papilionaceus]
MEQASDLPTTRDTITPNDAVVNWQGPLPEDLAFEIMATHIAENSSDFLALSSTCKGMYNCSLSLRYRKVIIKSNRIQNIPTPIEIFCGRLFQRPDIARFVQVLQIMGDGFVVDDQWKITTLEEDCLWYILNHKGFTNLKALALCLPILYDRLPVSIQEACFSILSNPTLENVKLSLHNVPTTVFNRLSGVTSIEVRGSVKFVSRSLEPGTMMMVVLLTSFSVMTLHYN